MLLKYLTAAVAVFCCVSTSTAEAVDLTALPWSVQATDIDNWNGTDLVFTSQMPSAEGFALEGYFDWKSLNVLYGRELFNGTLTSDLSLNIQGYQIIDGPEIVVGKYQAIVTADGSRIIDGTYSYSSGVGVWTAAAVPEPETYALMLAGLAVVGAAARRRKAK